MSIFDGHIDIPRGDPGEMETSTVFQACLTESLKGCSQSRYQVAGRMSELLGQEITKAMLDAWTATSKHGHRFPAEFLPAFCFASGSYEPLRLLGRRCGCRVLETNEAIWAALAQIEKEKTELQQKEKQLRGMVNARSSEAS